MYVTLLPQKDLVSLPEVTATKPYSKKTLFHPEGLYSEQIFGPVNDYQCQCKLYIGKLHEGKICPLCHVKITSSLARFVNFGRITLAYRVTHPYIVSFLSKEFGQQKVKGIIYGKKFYKVANKQLEEADESDPASGTGGDFLYKNLFKLNISDKNFKKFAMQFKDEMFPLHIPVLPVGTRNMLKVDNIIVVDDLNNIYVRMLRKNDATKRVSVFEKTLLVEYYEIQTFIDEFFQKVEEKLSKKKGLIRQNLLGKRADFSSRAVIVPNPKLDLNTVELPLEMCKELYKFHVLSYLINNKQLPLITAFDKLDTLSDDEYVVILDEILSTSCVILNRQPTLHRLGMISFFPKVKKDTSAIAIPVLVCPPFNADFDGDQIAVYLPLSEAALEETRTSLLAENQIISPSSRTVTFLPSHDIILGLYKLTKKGPDKAVSELSPAKKLQTLMTLDHNLCVTYKGNVTTIGRVIFNKILREKIPFVNEPVTKTVLYNVLQAMGLRPYLKDILEDIKTIGFTTTTQIGSSFSVTDFMLREAVKAKETITDVRDMKTMADLSDIMQNELEENPVFDMIKSGARGSWKQVSQISLFKGLVTDVVGNIQSDPITNCLIDGLTPQEFFRSSYGSRKGVVDSSLNTGTSGHLTRKLIFALSPCIINKELEDCGTDRFFDLVVDDGTVDFLKGRYIKEGVKIVEVTKPEKYLGKVVKLRSPIYCQGDRGFCKKCIGGFSWGEQVGILAAQAMGERATQMTLRTFHMGGVAESALGELLDKLNHKFLEIEDNKIIASKDGDLYLVDSDDDAEEDYYAIKFTGQNPIVFEKIPEIDLYHIGHFTEGTTLMKIDLQNQDIVSDLRQLRYLLDNKKICAEYKGQSFYRLFNHLLTIFKNYGLIDIIFLEVLLSQLAYSENIPLRFTQATLPDEIKTLSSLPLHTSIMQGMAFERFKSAVVRSLECIKDHKLSPNKTLSILEKIVMLEF